MFTSPLHAYVQLSLPPSCTHSAKVDPTLCRRVVFDGGLQSLSSAMKAFHWDSGLQVAAISALAVALASGKNKCVLNAIVSQLSIYGVCIHVYVRTQYSDGCQLSIYGCVK